MLNESSHLEYALLKYGDASFNTDSQSDLTKLPQISTPSGWWETLQCELNGYACVLDFSLQCSVYV